jgi:hypothetical protein
MAMPSATASSATAMPTVIETRAPNSTRLYTSRPRLSLPIRKRCSKLSPARLITSVRVPGSRLPLAGSIRVGSMVPSQGAAIAARISSASAVPPMRTAPLAKARRASEM